MKTSDAYDIVNSSFNFVKGQEPLRWMKLSAGAFTTVRKMTYSDPVPALYNVPEEYLSLTVLAHRWAMSYDLGVTTPRERDPFLLMRPGSRQSLIFMFKVSYSLWWHRYIMHIHSILSLKNK